MSGLGHRAVQGPAGRLEAGRGGRGVGVRRLRHGAEGATAHAVDQREKARALPLKESRR